MKLAGAKAAPINLQKIRRALAPKPGLSPCWSRSPCLDAAEEGAEWTEAVRVLFGLDPKREGERARRVYDCHLARALWMTNHGYSDLLKSALH